MNKEEAAKFLGVSIRALERYTQQNRIAARYEKGKTRSVLVYEQAELERFKSELENATVHRPAVEPQPREIAVFDKSANLDKPVADFGEIPDLGALSALAAFLQRLPAAQIAPETAPKTPETPPSEKLVLTLDEAQSYSGLSRSFLLDAIKNRKLAASKLGRGWKIKRRDLESFVDEIL